MSTDVAALFQQHKRTLAFVGAAAVGGLALMQARSKDSGGGADPAAGVVMPAIDRASTGGGPVAAWPIAGGFAPYDSGSSDLYNALQPQIEYLQRMYEKQQEQQGGPIPVGIPTGETPATPAPAAPAPAAPKYVSPAAGLKAGFYKMAGTPNVYKVSGGKIDYLTPKERKAMLPKGTKVTALSKDAPVFQTGRHWLDKHKQK